MAFFRKETNTDVENERQFLLFKILDFLSVLNVGYNITKTTRMSYLLRDKQGSYAFMQPYVWNHLCYSFRRPGYSKAVLVSFDIFTFRVIIYIPRYLRVLAKTSVII